MASPRPSRPASPAKAVAEEPAGERGPFAAQDEHDREHAERQAIVAALARSNGNILKASEILGVSRPTLYDLMHRLAIK